jgi:NAD dependent epimerase/dehydratase family enzyme
MRVLITGGPLCVRVCQLLAKDRHEILLLTDQSPAQLPVGVKTLHWDGRSVDLWHTHLQPDCAIINLVGAGEPLCDSFFEAAYTINQALTDTGIVPDTLLQAASVAYYGDAADDMLIELDFIHLVDGKGRVM